MGQRNHAHLTEHVNAETRIPGGVKTALELWQTCGVRVLPGKYLAKDFNGQSPGDRFIRVAMVSELEETKDGLKKIREFLN